ncbi:MAG: hypothetical protein IPH34_14275 [Chitinophagaceae bacterium]|nr:hypothetical protein [Chitinophagaceae bacterium]MBK8309821.1 hypothetical protein [Chitinophagaceae bacterium]MBP6478753.1 hypothetical protein [Chitinophagaceae bacterium]MBP7107900.1 hypothetical protein [Chitinophagaceae bacterium]MBP7316380.1 hypothetical protein [Chitinophagaceae bacterium]
MKLSSLLVAVCILFTLQSCEFSCSVGDKEEETKDKGTAVVKDGARIYNNIQLKTSGIKLEKAYLYLESGERVPDDNFVDFNGKIKLRLQFASDWKEENGKVLLGASEKIVAESGEVILEENDLFEKYPEGVSVEDSKIVFLSAILKLKPSAQPTSCTVFFRVWDKRSDAFVEGSYQLFSK